MRLRSLYRTAAATAAWRRGLAISAHLALTALGYFTGFALAFDLHVPDTALSYFIETLAYLVALRLALALRFGLHRGLWRHVGLRDMLQVASATTLGSLLFPAVLFALGRLEGIPASVFVLEFLLTTALWSTVRVVPRCVHEWRRRAPRRGRRRAFIIGAGESGEQLLRQILHDPRDQLDIVGLIDDDPAKQGASLHGVPVVGTSDELRRLAALYQVNHALIAIATARAEQLRRLIDRCTEAELDDVKLLPPLRELVAGEVHLSQVRGVQIEDLLGREPVTLDVRAVAPDVAGKVVVVTGAGGSIGAELARQVARFHPLRLVLIDRAESPLQYIHLEVSEVSPETQVVPVLASVTNARRLQQVFETHRPDCVFHAAAYKHVPMLEWNVVEGVWNNVIGTLRVARSAAAVGAAKFVLISTDKAVNPSSVLGATKLLAERVVLELPSLRASATDFRVVRFGNVLGSDGSVVPLFQRQLAAGGPLTVTHPEMRRYCMTIPEATQLVLQAAALPEAAGRIALLEMGTQVRILDLAEQMVRLAGLVPHRDVEIVFTGLRPGEKLEEELVAPHEVAVPTTVDKIRVVERNGTRGALARQLRYLTSVTARRDEQAIIRALVTLVPEYQPPLPVPPPVVRHNGGPVQRRNGGAARAPARRKRAAVAFVDGHAAVQR